MDIEKINAQMEVYVRTREMVGGGLIVRKDGEILLKNRWGSLDAEGTQPLTGDTIFRMASMTKPVTAVAVMKLVEQGKIGLDDELTKYVPAFRGLRVVADKRYEFSEKNVKKIPWRLLTFRLKNVVTVPADRMITVRDLLSHSSGLEQGLVGLILMMKMKFKDDTLETRVRKYATHPLDFQPGTAASYSPLAGFDVLARLVEIVTGRPFADYARDSIFTPLDMQDATYHPTQAQRARIPKLYQYNKGKLKDVTGSKGDINTIGRIGSKYSSGSAGLYATLEDYDRFAQMLANEGELDGVRILKPETVRQMRAEGAYRHLEFSPGITWGLGMIIRQDPEKAHSHAHQGTYGWSGHYGTHFFISPADHLSVVFAMNRADAGGADSYISKELEELVFESLKPSQHSPPGQ